jgi:hypothetical protein
MAQGTYSHTVPQVDPPQLFTPPPGRETFTRRQVSLNPKLTHYLPFSCLGVAVATPRYGEATRSEMFFPLQGRRPAQAGTFLTDEASQVTTRPALLFASNACSIRPRPEHRPAPSALT